MRFPRPRSSSKSSSSSSVSISGTISVVGSVKNTLKAKLSKTKSGKYSQKIFNRRGGCSAAKEAAVAEKDLPKLADLVEERREDAACGNGPTKIDMTCGRDATDANVEARDGPPEDDDDKEEPVVTTTTTTEVGGKQHPSTPTSPSIFGFHTVPSISPAPKNLPNVPETSTAKALPLISPAHSATTALSIHSQQVEMCPKEKKGPNEDDEIESEDETLAGEGIEEENGDASKIDIVFTKNEKEAAAVDMPTSTVRDETKQEAGASGLIYITPSVLAASSTNCELSTKLSMRSTVLVEDASAAGMSTDEDNDATDDEEDEGEDEYESDYDGSLADESAEHVITSPRNKFVSSQNDAKKKRRSKVNEKRLRDGHRRACKYLKNGEFSHALEEFEGILDELMNSLGDSHRRVGSALHNVGIVNIRADNLDDAIDAFEEAIRIRKDVHGPDHHLVADSLLELGIALLSQKDYEDALEIFNDVLEIRQNDLAEEARHGSDEDRIHCVLQVAKALNNIACVYFEYGELSKALKVLEDVLEMQQQAIDELTEGVPGHKQAKLSLATTLCNIGYVHADSDDWDNAIEFLDRAYAVSASFVCMRYPPILCASTVLFFFHNSMN